MDKKSNELTLNDVFLIIFSQKIKLTLGIILGLAVGVWVALSTPNIYRSSVLTIPSAESQGGGLGALAGQLGGLASIAGIKLGGESQDKLTIAMESITSKVFLYDVIEKNDWKKLIIGPVGWDHESNTLKYDANVYDSSHDKWVRDVSYPYTQEPSLFEVYKKFLEKNLRVSKSLDKGTVEISINHYSPIVAQEMVNILFENINEYMRGKDIIEAEKSVKYLTEKSKNVDLTGMKSVFYDLIEQQLQTIMLANVREEYFFQVIDPAIRPELPSSPNRILIVILGGFFGVVFGIITCIFTLIFNYFRKSDNG